MTRSGLVTNVVLVGGRALRLPQKLSLDVGGQPMLARVISNVTAGGRPCVISSRGPLDGVTGWPVALDEYEDGGPLGGIAAAAALVRTPLFFAVAGDMPNITARFIDELEEHYRTIAAEGRAAQAVLPTWPDGKVEPLAALYDARAFLDGATAALRAGKRKVTAALEGLLIVAHPVTAADEWTLMNVNTAQDYARLENA